MDKPPNQLRSRLSAHVSATWVNYCQSRENIPSRLWYGIQLIMIVNGAFAALHFLVIGVVLLAVTIAPGMHEFQELLLIVLLDFVFLFTALFAVGSFLLLMTETAATILRKRPRKNGTERPDDREQQGQRRS